MDGMAEIGERYPGRERGVFGQVGETNWNRGVFLTELTQFSELIQSIQSIQSIPLILSK